MKISSKIMAVALVAVVCFWGCKKDSSGKPLLKFKSVNTYAVPVNGLLSVTLECENTSDLKNAETDTALGIEFVVLNPQACVSSSGSKTRIYRTALPVTGSFSGTSEIVINWVNNNGVSGPPGYGALPNTNCRPVDSTRIRFWVKNKAGMVSDTVFTDKAILINH